MSRPFVSMLLLGISAVMVGMAVGYYVALNEGLPISEDVLVIIALIFVALLTAFHGGRSLRRTNIPSASLDRSWDAFRRELDRSRRFERPFVLMRIPTSEPLDATERAGASPTRGPLGALPLLVRSIDRVWTMDGSIYVVLPESSRASANELVARLRSTMSDAAALDGVQIAEFPQDGLTTGALLGSLRPAPAPGEAPPVRLVPARASADLRRDERTG